MCGNIFKKQEFTIEPRRIRLSGFEISFFVECRFSDRLLDYCGYRYMVGSGSTSDLRCVVIGFG